VSHMDGWPSLGEYLVSRLQHTSVVVAPPIGGYSSTVRGREKVGAASSSSGASSCCSKSPKVTATKAPAVAAAPSANVAHKRKQRRRFCARRLL